MQLVDEQDDVSWLSSSSFMTAFIRSSNCPRYFVPATRAARSSVTTRLPCRTRETFFWTMRIREPFGDRSFPDSRFADEHGLFFLRRLRT
jgi:hypothetical protein